MNIKDFCIDITSSLRSAMKKLDANACNILFILDSGKLFATLTDGDIRRFLLAGNGLDDSVEKAGNRSPKIARDVAQAKKLYHKKNYIAIPIVDEEGILIDIYFGEQGTKKIYKPFPNPVPVVINAGGKGTRLDPFTRVLPKPLVPVGDLPIIEHIAQEFKKYGCQDYHVIVNYKKELIKAYFNEAENTYDLHWYNEDKPLGTGGGLSLLKGQLKETFFFTNCDILLLSDYESMLRFHKENHNTITMICAYKTLTVPYGVIEMGKNGSITQMKEKPELSFLTNTGMYIVEPEVIEDIQDGVAIGFPDVIAMEQSKGKKVAVYPISENEWMDMGQIPELEQMRKKLYGE